MVASAKLASVMRQTPVILPKHDWILVAVLVGICTLGVLAVFAVGPALLSASLALILLSIILGVVFALRIGGADMPVLISFLNATAGLAASFCGIIIQNRLLIACGATVAASGSILTHVMCQAMNRNPFKLLVAADLKPAPTAWQTSETAPVPGPSAIAAEPHDSQKQAPLSCAVEAVRNAKKVILIPGYGMALCMPNSRS